MIFGTENLIGAVAGVVVSLGAISLLRQPPAMMHVHSISYEAGLITADRTVYRSGYMDWHVVILMEGDHTPLCATIHGDMLHEGWSFYNEGRQDNSMTLDIWAGDEGCLARLQPGLYEQYVTWTPRDGTEPITFSGTFTVTAEDILVLQPEENL